MWHRELPPSERHAIHAFEYADEAERLGATGLTANDEGKVAWQKDIDDFFVLVQTSPEVVWGPFTSHQHANKSTLDKITEADGLPLWDGGQWPGAATSDHDVAGYQWIAPTSSATYTYTDGLLTGATDVIDGLDRVATYSYTDGVPTSAAIVYDGVTRTETYTYTDGVLTGISVTEV